MWKEKTYLANMGRNEDHFSVGDDRQEDLVQERQMLKYPLRKKKKKTILERREKSSPHLSHGFEICKR